jgi:hypothetical protein
VVANCRRLGFAVAATVAIGPDRVPGSVADAVRAAVLYAFGFDRREFGEPVSAAQVVAVVQAVPGVCSVLLTTLALSPAADAVAEILLARPARTAPGGVLPAEILAIDADRIAVTEVPR